MGFLKIFSGKDPEEYERKGDSFFEIMEYGAARLEYETALTKMKKRCPEDTALENRLREKMIRSTEALALQHKENGELLKESGDYEGASELFHLALELTEDPELTAGLEQLLGKTQGDIAGDDMEAPWFHTQEDKIEDRGWHTQEGEYFTALCGALPDEVRDAYKSYGDTFKTGYVALNQSEYDLAATKLSQALEENPPDSLIPLELATAYLNLERYEDALLLLEHFIRNHPRSIHGYQVLCESLWAMKKFDEANDLLFSCPGELVESAPILHLKGESLYRSGRHQDAETFYLELLQSHGWDEHTALSLAATYEALGKKDTALELYSEIMGKCSSCGARVAPFIKQKYADISTELGDYSAKILEIYLSLIEEDPAGRENYFRKVGQIYTATGNEREARRYRSFADNMGEPPTD
ncbi:MAG: tetratricopeptide repeat protein [Deltaproteobacteria bacterium]|nr:tetratricopeptide repeat protein [Deltaproteobacteria bacterium]